MAIKAVGVLVLVLGLTGITYWVIDSILNKPAATGQHILLDPVKRDQYKFTGLTQKEKKVNLLDECKNHPCIVHFWASWCESCREELISFQDLQNILRLNKTPVKIFTIAYKDKREDALKLLQHLRVKPEGALFNDLEETEQNFKITGVPETFFVRAEGALISHVKGPISFQKMRSLVKQIIP